MDRRAFWHLHSLIQDDPIFVSTGKKPQRPSWLQLAVFLCRMGGKTAITTASFASISEGAVFLYTDRVCRALRNIRNNHVYWPDNAERERFSDAMSEWGFPGCLGSGDGTYVRLEKRPSQNGYAYWCRKKMYAVSDLYDTCINQAFTPSRLLSRLRLTIAAGSRPTTSVGPALCKTVVFSSPRIFGATESCTFAAMSTFWWTRVRLQV